MKRWIDKALLGAIALVLGLVGTLWAMMQSKVSQIDDGQRGCGERMRSVETRLDTIDKRQDRMDGKLDQIIDKLKR